MLARAVMAFLISVLFILSYEYLYHKSSKAQRVPLFVGWVILIATLAFYLSAIYLGALAAGHLIPTDSSLPMKRVGLLVGIFVVIWSSSILLQVAQNGVRKSMGERTFPIEWYRHPLKRRPPA